MPCAAPEKYVNSSKLTETIWSLSKSVVTVPMSVDGPTPDGRWILGSAFTSDLKCDMVSATKAVIRALIRATTLAGSPVTRG